MKRGEIIDMANKSMNRKRAQDLSLSEKQVPLTTVIQTKTRIIGQIIQIRSSNYLLKKQVLNKHT